MNFILSILIAILLTIRGQMIYEPTETIEWVKLCLLSALCGFATTSAFTGLLKSFEMEIRIVKKYFKNKDAVFKDPNSIEPAQLGFMSGRWLFIMLHFLRDTWKSFFSEVQWAYKPKKARSFEEVVHGRDLANPIVQDDLEGEKLYREWMESHITGERIADLFRLRIINGTVFILVGSLLAMLFSAICIGAGICSLPYVLVFSVAWMADRFYLICRKISQPCDNCQSKHLFLHYECPKCGAIHKKLVPGPHGVFTHKCKCSHKMPSTFFNGREMKSKPLCPTCGKYIKSAGTRPFMIQLIGGSNAGKTVFITAYFHDFIEKINQAEMVQYMVDNGDKALFADLADWYQGVPCASTVRMNSQMYPLQIYSNKLDVARKFILYDIAGEMFNKGKADAEINQKQFHYCDGIVFILDPFSNDAYRSSVIQNGDDLPQYSDIESQDVVNTFLNYMMKTGHKKVGAVYQTPFSVVITKADVRAIRQKINMMKIMAEFKKNSQYHSVEETRDNMCRQFLEEIGLSQLTSTIETRFKNVHYFLASPIGHEPDGSPFDSWGVLEPVEWILKEQDESLHSLIYGMHEKT